MRHAVQLVELVRHWVEDRCSRITIERIILHRPADNHAASIGKERPAIAEDIPEHWLNSNGLGCQVPYGCFRTSLQMFIRIVLRSSNDQQLAIAQQVQTNRVDGHQIGERYPLTGHLGLGNHRL